MQLVFAFCNRIDEGEETKSATQAITLRTTKFKSKLFMICTLCSAVRGKVLRKKATTLHCVVDITTDQGRRSFFCQGAKFKRALFLLKRL